MITLSREELSAHYLEQTEPVLVTDGLMDWPAAHRWSPTFLAASIGERTIDVAVSSDGSFQYQPDGTARDPANQFTLTGVPLRQAVELILQAGPSSPRYYISQQNVLTRLPQLLQDLRFPKVCTAHQINLWFGSAGTVTPLHYDVSNNLFAQIYGSKLFTIFSPQETGYLYPFPADSRLKNLSHVDLEKPDRARHALFTKARSLTFTIEPGQLLFLPAFWWHHVRANSIAISVSQWWKVPDPQRGSQAVGKSGFPA